MRERRERTRQRGRRGRRVARRRRRVRRERGGGKVGGVKAILEKTRSGVRKAVKVMRKDE